MSSEKYKEFEKLKEILNRMSSEKLKNYEFL